MTRLAWRTAAGIKEDISDMETVGGLKIMLMGSPGIAEVPDAMLVKLKELLEAGYEFIVGDRDGADKAWQKALCSIGAYDKSTVYSMGDTKNNLYELPTRNFDIFYDEATKKATIALRKKSGAVSYVSNELEIDEGFEPVVLDAEFNTPADIQNNKQYYQFRDRQMINDCVFAIALWNGSGKSVTESIKLLGIKDKPCYTVQLA